MSTFTVVAVDPTTGQRFDEKVQADNVELARANMTTRGLTVVDVKKAGLGLNGDLPFMKARVKPRDLAVFSRQFATMINAGMPMLRAMSIMVRQTDNTTLREVLREVQADLEGGSRLSEAIAKHDVIFPPLMVSMIRAGELGGFLDKALLEVATAIEKDVKLRGKIKSASTYPVVVMSMGVLGTIAMLLFVVPTFTSMFTDLGGELPLPTRIVVVLSDGLKVAGLPLVALIIAFVIWWRNNKNKRAVRDRVDPIKLRLPIFGSLIKKIALSRFARNLSVMLGAGVPILDALAVVADTADNAVVRNAVLAASAKVETGGTLSDHLGIGGVIPDMVVQMVAVGEESGATDSMLAKVATFYDEEVESTTEALASLIEPILIVAMGIVLGSLVIAMYMPTFAVFDLVK